MFLGRPETRAGAAGGARLRLPEQRGLFPPHHAQTLLHVERGVCQRHREGQGETPPHTFITSSCPTTAPVVAELNGEQDPQQDSQRGAGSSTGSRILNRILNSEQDPSVSLTLTQ